MPMEQAFRHCDKDTLKMAMLKHEETFRQQVHELHRLYRIQKLLMRDLNRELKSQRNVSTSHNGGDSITEHRRGAFGVCSYEQRYATRGRGHVVAAAMAAPRTALSLDVLPPAAVEYVRSTEDDDDDEAEETDDEAELELTLAVGGGCGGGGAKKRYGEYPSGGESHSSSSTESDVLLTASQEWRQARRVAAGSPCHFKMRPAAGLEAEDGVGMQPPPPPPLLFHWLSLKMA